MREMNKKNEIFDHTQRFSQEKEAREDSEKRQSREFPEKIEKSEKQGEIAENQRKNDLKYDFWLASLTNINSSKRIQVRELCGSAQAVYELREETLKNMHLFTDNELQHLLESRKKDLNRAWERFLGQNIQMFPIGSKKYPQRLKDIAQPPYGDLLQGFHARCKKKRRHRRCPHVFRVWQKYRHKAWQNAGRQRRAGDQRHGTWHRQCLSCRCPAGEGQHLCCPWLRLRYLLSEKCPESV